MELSVGEPESFDPGDVNRIFEFTDTVKSKIQTGVTLFAPHPSQIFFESYQPFKTHTQVIKFRNRDVVPRRIRIHPPDGLYFGIKPKFKSKKGCDTRVAPGMSASFEVQFTPDEKKEYVWDLVVETEREKFLVPIRAFGKRPKLEVPSQIAFESIPVNTPGARAAILRNVGDGTASWSIECSEVFQISPTSGELRPNQTQTLQAKFLPDRVATFEGAFVVTYLEQRHRCDLVGSSYEATIDMDREQLDFEPTYINLYSRRSVRLTNSSDIPLKYSWKENSKSQEDKIRQERFNEIETDVREDFSLPPLERAQALQRARREIQRQIDEVESEPMHFCSNTFSIEPISGEIHPGGFHQFICTFHPKAGQSNGISAYCDVQGHVDRLPLTMSGTGIGPKAVLSYEMLDVGRIYIGAVHNFVVTVHNVGDIPAEFEMEKKCEYQISFDPKSGKLDPAEAQNVSVTFTAKELGDFQVVAHCKIIGRVKPLILTLRGEVVNPTLRFDVERLDFGDIGFGFKQTQVVELTNASTVPAHFAMRMGGAESKEFSFAPHTGLINANSAQSIDVSLTAETVKRYNCAVKVDLVGSARDYLSLPTSATCSVAQLILGSEDIDFGDVHYLKSYEQILTLRNPAEIPARFQFYNEPNSSNDSVEVSMTPHLAVVKPETTMDIKVKIVAKQPGPVQFKKLFKVFGGQDEDVLTIDIKANCLGPALTFVGEEPLVSFGKIAVLTPHVKTITLRNDCPIPAPYTLFFDKKGSPFKISDRRGVIEPEESKEFRITAFAADDVNFKVDLLVDVEHGEPMRVAVQIRGIGTTIKADKNLDVVDLGSHLTQKTCQKSIRLRNRGKRAQTVVWNFLRVKDAGNQHSEGSDDMEKPLGDANSDFSMISNSTTATVQAIGALNSDGGQMQEHVGTNVFSVNPSKMKLNPGIAVDFIITGKSNDNGVISEMWECRSSKGKGAPKLVMETVITATFVAPRIIFSDEMLNFEYLYDPEQAMRPIERDLTMTNPTTMPLNFILKCPMPFSVDQLEHTILPNQSAPLKVFYDAGLTMDRQCHKPRTKLKVRHRAHKHRDSMILCGESWFPNVKFSSEKIDFGFVVNDSRNVRALTIENVSKVPVKFTWVFLVDEEPIPRGVDPLFSVHKLLTIVPKKKRNHAKGENVTSQYEVQDLVDIQPAFGEIPPHGKVNANVFFSSVVDCEVLANVALDVEGGPEYGIAIKGKSNSIAYDISENLLDFGEQPFTETCGRTFTISNNSRVAFEFDIDTSTLSRPGVIIVDPVHGRVAGGHGQIIKVTFYPRLPQYIEEKILVNVDCFAPEEVWVLGHGIYPQISTDLPRVGHGNAVVDENEDKQALYAQRLESARQNVISRVHEEQIQAAASSVHVGDVKEDDENVQLEDSVKDVAVGPEEVNENVEEEENVTETAEKVSEDDEIEEAAEDVPEHESDAAPKPSYEPDEEEVLQELERVIYVEKLQQKRALRSSSSRSSVRTHSRNSTRPGTGASRRSNKRDNNDVFVGDISFDFGTVVLGTKTVKKFQITNVSHQLDARVDLGEISDCPFDFSPKRFKIPKGSSETISVTFNGKSAKSLGHLFFGVPIVVQGGPCYNLKLKCKIVVPKLALTGGPLIDFGEIALGCCKYEHVAIENRGEVQAKWKFATHDQIFKIEPSEGSLEVGETIVCKVTFTPVVISLTKQSVHLRVSHGLQKFGLSLRGSGWEPEFQITPADLISLNPVTPDVQSEMQSFTIENTSNRDIEVFCLNFDSQYIEEKEYLDQLEYDDNGVFFGSIRNAGDRLIPGDVEEKAEDVVEETEVENVEQMEADEEEVVISKPNVFVVLHQDESRAQHIANLYAAETSFEQADLYKLPLESTEENADEQEVNDNEPVEDGEKVEEDMQGGDKELLSVFMNSLPESGDFVIGLTSGEKTLDILKEFHEKVDLKVCIISDVLSFPVSTRPSSKHQQSEADESVERKWKQSLDTLTVRCFESNVFDDSMTLPRIVEWVPKEADLPSSGEHQIYYKSHSLKEVKPCEQFKIYTAAKVVKDDDASANENEEEEIPSWEPTSRWVMKANTSLEVKVAFQSDATARFKNSLQFQVVGKEERKPLLVSCVCDRPKVAVESKDVFKHHVRHRRPGKIIHCKFVETEKVFDFGPLISNGDGAKDVLRFANIGLFPLKATLQLKDITFEKTQDQDSAQPDDMEEIFSLQSTELELEVDESKMVPFSAKPNGIGVFKATIEFTIEGEEPVFYSIMCEGAVPKLSLDRDVVEFERLLCGKDSQRTMVNLKNLTNVTASWKFDEANDEAVDAFQILPMEGFLNPMGTTSVSVNFLALKDVEQILQKSLNLTVTDQKGDLGPVQELPLQIKGELFNVKYNLEVEEGMLDFGLLRVGEEKSLTFTLTNDGKYSLFWKMTHSGNKRRARWFDELFKVEPRSAELGPGESSTITVSFKAATGEVKNFNKSKDMRIEIFEGQDQNTVFSTETVIVNASAVYSTYTIAPLCDINFGAMEIGKTRTKTLHITNDGEFDFDFKILSDGAEPQECLTLNDFTIQPAMATVEVGKTAEVEIKLNVKNMQRYLESISIDISDSDPGIPSTSIELAGEGCSPGIETQDFESIFEEQGCCLKTPLGVVRKNMFVTEDRVFLFKPMIVSQKDKNELSERFKISNPFKVPCDVKFTVESRGDEECPFTIEPSEIRLPSHESQFVTCTFQTDVMQVFTGTFRATVEQGFDQSSKELAFEIRGIGTLPRVTVSDPAERDDSKRPMISFPRTFVGEDCVRTFTVKNDDMVPATFRFELSDEGQFRFSGRGALHQLEVGQSQTFEVTYSPREIGNHEFPLSLIVVNNNFERTDFAISGEAYEMSVSVEKGQNVNFGEALIGQKSKVEIVLVNHTDSHQRFEFGDVEMFAAEPKVGHLKPKSKRAVIMSFVSEEKKTVENAEMNVKCTPIQTEETLLAWDSSLTEIQVVSAEDYDEKYKERFPDAIAESDGSYTIHMPLEEPQFEATEDATEFLLSMTAKADVGRLEFESETIQFKPTMMFRSCAHSYTIRNACAIAVDFNWKVDGPFTVSPAHGSIPGGEEVKFTITFEPLDAGQFEEQLECEMSNLAEDQTHPILTVLGTSLRPMLHFDLESSDYLTGGRRPVDGDHLDPSTTVIEIISLGTNVRNTRRFQVLNPTNMAYKFEWVSSGARNGAFHCLTSRGTILSGQRAEMAFEYIPESTQSSEVLWNFTLPEHNISVPLLTVGSVTEPDVRLDRNHVKFVQQLVGTSTEMQVYLVNNEHIPFAWAVDRSSYVKAREMNAVDGRFPLEISPMSGAVGPGMRVPINVHLTCLEELNYNFNLGFNIKNKPAQAFLNIKGEGYIIRSVLELEDEETGELTRLTKKGSNDIRFGTVHIKEKKRKHLIVVNESRKFPFDFRWKLPPNNYVSITPETGTVQKGQRIPCELVFSSEKETVLDDLSVNLLVNSTSRFALDIHARAKKPNLVMSSRRIDFGPCFLHHPNAEPEVRTICITNKERESSVSIDILFERKPFLDIRGSRSLVIAPGEEKSISLVFLPCEARSYSETIPFEINGLYTVPVRVQGEGTARLVQLVDPSHETLSFGNVRVSQTKTKSVGIVNQSRRSAAFIIQPNPRLESKLVSIHPRPGQVIRLRPKEVQRIDFRYAPSMRLAPFTCDVDCTIENVPKKFLTVHGACIGMGARFERDTLDFGAVMKCAKKERQIKLQNTGDIGFKYKFEPKLAKPHFMISPDSGYVDAHESATISVVFAPGMLGDDLQARSVPCHIEGYQSMYVTFKGACVAQPVQEAEVLEFETQVRKSEEKTIKIENKTDSDWNLTPVIENAFWTGADRISVKSRSAFEYAIRYQPLTMTTHEGSIFFPLPDGTVLLRKLHGNATPPDPEAIVDVETPCKVVKIVPLRIRNWLKKTQRFRVELIPAESEEEMIFLQGAEWLDVPALMQREYRLRFRCLKACDTSIKARFVSPSTGEYLEYQINVTVKDVEVLEVINLKVPVREITSTAITISNPLTKDVLIDSAECENETIWCENLPLKIPAGTDAHVEVKYRPITIADVETTLRLKCDELGEFLYELKLSGTPVGPDKTLRFNANLGDQDRQVFRFQSYSKQFLEYSVELDGEEFQLQDKTIKVTPNKDGHDGTFVSVDVVYTPSGVGEIRNTLKVISDVGGVYECILFGKCKPPRAQGPFHVNKGGSTSIEFVNVFQEAMTFDVMVGTSAFQIGKSEISLKAKESAKISVTFKPPADVSKTVMDKLVISCGSTQWLYYLKGVC